MKRILLTAINLVIAIGVYAQPNVVEIEFFLDTDLGFGMNNEIIVLATPEIDITEVVLANIPSSTSLGYHKLYFRTKDESGNWSHTTRKNIVVVAPLTDNNVVTGEYFIDVDPMFGSGDTFTINPEEPDVQQAFDAQILSTTPLGYHKLYARVRDINGNWSHTFRRNIQVYLNPETNIVEIEYFFEDDLEFGNNTIVSVDIPESDGTWNINVPYPTGNYSFDDVLFVRVKDSNGNWSITTILDEIDTLSAEETLYQSTKIYPNPFVDEIRFESTHNIDFKTIQVFDSTGKVVFRSDSNLKRIYLGNLQQGVYVLKLVTEMSEVNFKIIKQ